MAVTHSTGLQYNRCVLCKSRFTRLTPAADQHTTVAAATQRYSTRALAVKILLSYACLVYGLKQRRKEVSVIVASPALQHRH
jgi:hypothetical protein